MSQAPNAVSRYLFNFVVSMNLILLSGGAIAWHDLGLRIVSKVGGQTLKCFSKLAVNLPERSVWLLAIIDIYY
jgi:hypothetical protein